MTSLTPPQTSISSTYSYSTYIATQFAVASPVGAATSTTYTYSKNDVHTIEVFVTQNVAATCHNMLAYGLPLEPNPDVSGLGVILAFVISAYVVQCWSIFAYFAGLLPPSLLRAVDVRIFKTNSRHVDSEWHDALQTAAIIFSDQQIITGIGILLAGFSNITSNLSVYHWQIITYLAWMSSNVHLTTLTLLRDWLHTNNVLRRWRLTGMAVLMVFLLCALVPMRTYTWANAISHRNYSGMTGLLEHDSLGVPAVCLWSASGAIDPDVAWTFAILIISYVWKIGQLFDTSRFHLKKWLRSAPECLLERAAVNALKAGSVKTGIWVFGPRIGYRIILAFYVPATAFAEFCESFVASLWILSFGLTWGSVQIFITRDRAPFEVMSAESTWGFGQILPMLFLLQPAAALFEHFYASHRIGRAKPKNPSTLQPTLAQMRTNQGLICSNSSMTATSTTGSFASRDFEVGESCRNSATKLSDVLRNMKLKNASSKAQSLILEPHIEFMYTSRFFVLLIWLINILVFLLCAFMIFCEVAGVFLYPANLQLWQLSLSCIAGSISFIFALSCGASFTSKLYR